MSRSPCSTTGPYDGFKNPCTGDLKLFEDVRLVTSKFKFFRLLMIPSLSMFEFDTTSLFSASQNTTMA